MRKKELCCDQRHYIHIHVYIMSLATSWMIALLTTHKILNKRRIKGLVYRTGEGSTMRNIRTTFIKC